MPHLGALGRALSGLSEVVTSFKRKNEPARLREPDQALRQVPVNLGRQVHAAQGVALHRVVAGADYDQSGAEGCDHRLQHLRAGIARSRCSGDLMHRIQLLCKEDQRKLA